jgi:hypothetical protein
MQLQKKSSTAGICGTRAGSQMEPSCSDRGSTAEYRDRKIFEEKRSTVEGFMVDLSLQNCRISFRVLNLG